MLIPADASAIHGISNEMVSDAPNWADIWPHIYSVLAGTHLGIYNEEFDIRLLRQSSQQNNLEWLPPYKGSFDVMGLFAEFYGDWNEQHKSFRWQKLSFAGTYLDIDLPNSHRALDDALLAREVFLRMGADNI